MKATTPPRFCASAMTCWQTVVLPDDSGPKISVIRPRGMPPTPSARSSAMDPVGIEVHGLPLGRAELHDRAATELLLDRQDRGIDRLAALGQRLAPSPALVPAVIAIVSVRSSSVHRPTRRSGTRCVRPAGQPSSGSVLVAGGLRGFRSPRRCVRRLRERRQLRLGRTCPSASSWLPCWGRSREPIGSPPRRLQATERTSRRLHRRFTATHPDRRARRSPGSSDGEGAGAQRGPDPGHEV